MALIEVNVDIEDYLSEVDTEDLEEELKTRKDSALYKVSAGQKVENIEFEEALNTVRYRFDTNKNYAREVICDLLGCGHMTGLDDILTELKARLS